MERKQLQLSHGWDSAAEADGGVFSSLAAAPKRKRGLGREAVTSGCECHVRVTDSVLDLKALDGAEEGADSEGSEGCLFYAAAERRLYAYGEAPAALRYNKFIRSGYRAGLSYRQCMCSMLEVHNETGNILTHLLPALVLVWVLATDMLRPWPGARLEFLFNVFSVLLCFCGSVAYHTAMANHHAYTFWLKLDICGVLVVLVGGGHMALWWGLHCHPALRVLYVVLYYSAGAACLWGSLRAETALKRGLPMLALLLVRLSSHFARAALAGWDDALQHYAWMEVCTLAGGLINGLRVPERWFQPRDPSHAGPLDYWLNSHQIMHVLVTGAMLHLHLGATADYEWVVGLRSGLLQCPAP